MFNLTSSELAGKTSRQLASLFNQASHHLAGLHKSDRKRALASSLLGMIRAELARRGP